MKGQGCLYRRGSTWWIGYVSPRGYVRESSGSEVRADALDLLKKRQADVLGGWNPGARKTTVNELLDVLLRDYEMHGRASQGTVKGHVSTLQGELGNALASSITYATAQGLVQRWQAEGRAPATINRLLATLRRAFRLGELVGLVDRVPPFPHLREDNVRQGFVEGEQLTDVLGLIEDTNVRDLVEWLSVAGMRVGEASRLEWKHLHQTDQGETELRVPAELTKNRQPRVLPIAGPLKAIIYRRRAARRLDCVLIFHRSGKAIKDFRAAWATACKRAGRAGLLVHDLRRSAIRALRQAGVSEEIAMRISGHQTASVFRRYRIVTTDDQRAALQRLVAEAD